MAKAPLTVCITGAAGQIGYALLPHLCSGKTFGPDQPIKLHLLDLGIEGVQVALGGVKMELEDSTYPLLKGVVTTGDAKVFRPHSFITTCLLGFCARAHGTPRNCSREI
jgi:malate/lactate dehydrogenase